MSRFVESLIRGCLKVFCRRGASLWWRCHLVAEWEEIAEERIVMTEEPHTVSDLEEVRKLYIEMIKIRSGEELEKLRQFFEDQLERMRRRAVIARELKLPEGIVTSKNMLAMMYKNLIELCIKKARGEPIE
jgi:hypothetical protein